MSRLERLVNLTAALLDTKQPLSAEQVRRRVPGYPDEKTAFRRTFERDKEALRELGLPLVTHSDGKQTTAPTYTIDRERYYVRDPGLNPAELSALTMAAEVVRLNGLGDRRLQESLWKIGNTGSDAAEPAERAAAAATSIGAELPADATVAAIFEAIASGQSIQFTYRDELRHVVPRSLSFEKGRWYLASYDLERSDDRSFRIDRMSSDILLRAIPEGIAVPSASRNASPTRFPWELGIEEPVTTVVQIDATQAAWAERQVDPTSITARSAAGGIEITLKVRNRDALRSFVIGFLNGATIVSPPEAKADLVAWLQSKQHQSKQHQSKQHQSKQHQAKP
jgi:proteasome accessory factor B